MYDGICLSITWVYPSSISYTLGCAATDAYTEVDASILKIGFDEMSSMLIESAIVYFLSCFHISQRPSLSCFSVPIVYFRVTINLLHKQFLSWELDAEITDSERIDYDFFPWVINRGFYLPYWANSMKKMASSSSSYLATSLHVVLA